MPDILAQTLLRLKPEMHGKRIYYIAVPNAF